MKGLSLLVALSALLVAGTATTVNAQSLTGTVLIRDSGPRDIPAGVNEVGRFARFIGDDRMLDTTNLRLSNRDYENWKPLDGRSKELMEHHMFGSLKVHHSLVPEQETGRFSRFVVDSTMAANNMWLENRDFENFKVNGATSRNAAAHYLRGLPTGNLGPYGAVQIGAIRPVWY